MTARSTAKQSALQEPLKSREWPDREFGGVAGTIFLMLWSHYILYYVWYCLTEANGNLIIPLSIADLIYHLKNFLKLFILKCIPSVTTWGAYASFFFFQLILARIMPGMVMQGIPITNDGKRLPYLCNGYLCYYACLWGFFLMHNLPAPLDFYRATHLSEHYGEYITAAIAVADLTSIFWYVYGLYTSSKKVSIYSPSLLASNTPLHMPRNSPS